MSQKFSWHFPAVGEMSAQIPIQSFIMFDKLI